MTNHNLNSVTRRKKRRVLSGEQGHRCAYCVQPIVITGDLKSNKATIDHIVPVSAGGSNSNDNIVAACLRCNKTRGSLDAFAFYSFVLYCKEHDITISHRNLKDWL